MHSLVDQTVRVRCFVCGSDADDLLLIFRGYRIARCADCDFVFVNPRPTEESLIKLYADRDSNPFFAEHYEPFEYEAPILTRVVRKLQQYAATGALLEVGCGRGDFLRVAQMHGFSVTGCDIFGGHLPADAGLTLHDGTLQEALFPDHRFDVVVVRNILEHLFDPNAVLNEIARILKPQGYLYVKVPNVDFEYGLRCRLMLGKAHAFDPPYHLNYFSPTSLQRCLRQADLNPVAWYLEQPTLQANWAKNLARQAGYRVFQAMALLSAGRLFPKPLLACVAQRRPARS